jgi:ketosteroid isomerase-like protein
MQLRSLLGACLAALSMSVAWAGPLDERAAAAHIDAIAAGDLDALMSAYSDEPWFDWVGGALDGRYRGRDEVRGVWQKFIAANEGKPRTVTRTTFVQNANPTGVTLVANAEYVGKTTVRVRHVFVYRGGKLATEVWQIDPKAELTPAAASTR